jgi:cytoskeletal protein CcmA (bactofilin family)
MSLTNSQLQQRIESIESWIDYLQQGLGSTASRTELNNLIALITAQISSLQDVVGTLDSTVALYPPRLTTEERDALTVTKAATIFNTTLNLLQVYDGTTWQNASFWQALVDHGSISGLGDDDHPQYLLTDGSRNVTGDIVFDTDVDISGDLSVVGDVSASNLHVEETAESFTVYLNPDTGTDPATNTSTKITTQAQSTAYGKFASIKGVMRSLPSKINHNVTIQIDDGSFAISDTDWAHGLSAVDISPVVFLVLTSESFLSQVSGTVTSTVQSTVSGREITLTEDPGYAEDEHRKKWLQITSGTGAGLYKPIRSHNGTYINVAGRFDSIDATSQVSVFEPSTVLTFDEAPSWNLPFADNNSFDSNYNRGFVVKGIEINFDAGASSKEMDFFGGVISFDGVTLVGSIFAFECNLMVLNNLIVTDGPFTCFGSFGSFLRTGGSYSSWYFADSLIGLYCAGITNRGKSSLYLFRGAIDNCLLSGMTIFGESIDIQGKIRGENNTTGISLGRGARLRIDISENVTAGILGNSRDIILGGDDALGTTGLQMSYAYLNALRSATGQPAGDLFGYTKILKTENNTSTGTATLTYTNSGTTLAYTAPGDSVGAAVDVSSGGEFILKSNNGKWIQVWVDPTLPVGDTSDTFTVGQYGTVIENNGSFIEVY